MKYYKNITLAENVTANGDYPADPVLIEGEKSIAMYGTFDTATVEIVLFTQRPDGTLEELPISTDLTYTEAEAPSVYTFPKGMPAKVRVSSVGVSTNISVNIHDV